MSRTYTALATPPNVAETEADAVSFAKGIADQVRPRVNSHIHLPPNFSAFDTTEQAVQLAAAQGIGVLGVSNYYDYSVYPAFAAAAGALGIFPLFGIEIISLIEPLVRAAVRINDPGNPGKMYICGKGITRFNPMSETAARLLQEIRDNDSERMAALTSKLAVIFAANGLETGLDADAIKDRIVARHGSARETVYLQERHAAQAFQEVLFESIPGDDRGAFLQRLFNAPPKAQSEDAVAVQNEIRSHLIKAGKPAFVKETFVGFDHAYQLILALGGIPCYPTLADGASPICQYEESPAALVADLKARGIYSAEFIPIRNCPEILTQYARAMRGAGLFVTAGTEHNTLDLVPMEPTCLGGAPIPEDIKDLFWEGACVVAAHQHVTLQGRPGYVDPEGQLNPDFSSDEERLAAFRQIGAEVITRYQKSGSVCGLDGEPQIPR